MAEDTEEEIGHAGETASGDVDEYLLIAGAGAGVVFILALIFDYKQLANLGVGVISSSLAPFNASGNGLGELITAFFQGLSKDVSNGLLMLGFAFALRNRWASRIFNIILRVI